MTTRLTKGICTPSAMSILSGCGMLLLFIDTAHAGSGCDLDHFMIGQLGGQGSQTGQLFADVDDLYSIHSPEPPDPSTKPYASHYPLFWHDYTPPYYSNGEPGSEQIENDPERELVGTRLADYDIWLEIVDTSGDIYVGCGGEWYYPGDCIHLSSQPWHHLHMTYWVWESQYSEDRLFYVVYRLLDELDDGQQYQPSDAFWVVFNREIPGDFNRDGHIDSEDFDVFQACVTGPTVPYDPGDPPVGCTLEPDAEDIIPADLDRDGDVDQSDFGMLQRCISGPDHYADPRCAE